MIIEEFPVKRKMFRDCKLFNPGLGIFPVLFSTVVSLTFIVTYIISVNNNHVYAYLPTISDTGGLKPESNIFALFLSTGSFLGFVVVLIRYIQFRHISEYNEEDRSKLTIINKVGFVIGIVACAGATLVATFQDRGKSAKGHMVGALTVFGGGVVYTWFQTYLSLKMLRCGMNTRRLCCFRLILAVAGTIFFVGFTILYRLATQAWNNHHNVNHSYATWQSEDGGYALHVISSVCEWLCALSILLLFLSFNGEFNKIKIGFSVARHDVNILPFQTSTEEREPLAYA